MYPRRRQVALGVRQVVVAKPKLKQNPTKFETNIPMRRDSGEQLFFLVRAPERGGLVSVPGVVDIGEGRNTA